MESISANPTTLLLCHLLSYSVIFLKSVGDGAKQMVVE